MLKGKSKKPAELAEISEEHADVTLSSSLLSVRAHREHYKRANCTQLAGPKTQASDVPAKHPRNHREGQRGHWVALCQCSLGLKEGWGKKGSPEPTSGECSLSEMGDLP